MSWLAEAHYHDIIKGDRPSLHLGNSLPKPKLCRDCKERFETEPGKPGQRYCAKCRCKRAALKA